MRSGSILRIAASATALVAATAAVTVWSLAPPASDPAGDAIDWVQARQNAVAQWYARGPVDALPDWHAMRMQVPLGDAVQGRALMKVYGCGACHVIPGVAGAQGTVGPSLSMFADRAYIAGILTNAPGDLTRWLINPPFFAPDTAMPDLGVTQADAMHMAAYLYTMGDGG